MVLSTIDSELYRTALCDDTRKQSGLDLSGFDTSVPSRVPTLTPACSTTRLFPPPDSRLVASVVVPARDEEARLPALVDAMAAQVGEDGRPLPPGVAEVLVLLNNCRDGSAEAVAYASARHPELALRVAEVDYLPDLAHVGHARRVLMDAASARLHAVGRPAGAILSTDADTVPARTWISATLAELADGVDAVGGRALLLPTERAALPAGVRRLYLLDLAYRRALEELRELYAPEPWDPLPRHHHHFGASLAVSARAYTAVGGIPSVCTYEDTALVNALRRSGRRLRHSPRVRVYTSARASGRASGGLAAAFAFWSDCVQAGREPLVEPAADAERRLAAFGRSRANAPDAPPPIDLIDTPDIQGAPLAVVIADLRRAIARLRPLSLHTRLARSR